MARYQLKIGYLQGVHMNRLLASLVLLSGIALTSLVFAQTPSPTAPVPSGAVTTVIQITPLPGAKPEALDVAMRDMLALIKKQPGFIADEFLKNLNPGNTPSHVHVIRWAALKNWEAVFISPEFTKLNSANAKQFTVSVNAFMTVK
jgi:heme-degrading monooxygenase HmoA